MQVMEQIKKSRMALDEKVLSRKKNALAIVEEVEKNQLKSKHPLSAVEKKQIVEDIEKNSIAYSNELKEELEEAKAMQKKAFGHPLNAAEKVHVEKFEKKFEEQMAMNQLQQLLGMY